jgi:hypothetical protein
MTIPGVTPFEGTLPQEDEPASFSSRAEALFDWLVVAAEEIDDVADGINVALNDNGTVLDATALAVQLTTNANTIVTTGGTGNAYTITPAASIPGYADGQTFMLRTNRANTGAVTLNVGGLGAQPVRKRNNAGTGFVELAAGDWNNADIHVVGYQGGQFELLTVPLQAFVRNDSTQTITGAWTFSATATFGSASFTTVDATNRLRVSAAVPIVELAETDAGNATHNRNRISRDGNVLRFSTVADNGTNVANDYEITLGSSGAVTHSFRVAGTQRLQVTGSGISVTGSVSVSGAGSFGSLTTGNVFTTAGNPDIGSSTLGRFGTIFLVNSPNVSSDARLKEDIADLTFKEKRAAAKMRARTFTMNGQKKVGYIAQEIEAAMASEGLDAVEYGLVTIGEDDMRGVDMDAINAFRFG